MENIFLAVDTCVSFFRNIYYAIHMYVNMTFDFLVITMNILKK